MDIDFDTELSRGCASYNDRLGEWWRSRAADSSHIRAYRNIAAFVRASFARPPGLILDYACGTGDLLARIGELCAKSRLVGVDGSAYMLSLARRRLARLEKRSPARVRLIEALLPDFGTVRLKADVVLYCFPNMLWPAGAGVGPRPTPSEIAIARRLAREGNCARESAKTEENYALLIMGRMVSLNLRRLLKRGGFCFRAEYADARREELCLHDLFRISFEEGSLEVPIAGRHPRQWFRVAASAFFRSGVIGDVHHQAGHSRTGRGGYLITVLRAL